MKVVLSADGSPEAVGASEWYLKNLSAGDVVLAVAGLSQFGEFTLGVPLFDALGGEHALLERVEQRLCAPLADLGVRCRAILEPHSQARAVVDVAVREHADLIVLGKRPHGRIGDAVRDDVATKVLHHPPCPVMVVPLSREPAAEPTPAY